MTTIQKSIVAVGVSLAVGVAIYQTRENSRLSKENRLVRAQAAMDAKSAQRLSELEQERTASLSRLDRAREAQGETLRLRGEVARLRSQIGLYTNLLVQRTAATNQIQFPLPVLKFSTKTASPMQHGQTLITGGWPADNGQRTFILLTLAHPKADGESALSFQGAVLEMTDQTATALGLEGFLGEPSETSPSGLLDLAESDASRWVTELKDAGFAEIVSTPSIVTQVGQEAKIFIGNLVPIGDGQYAPVGRNISVLPVSDEKGLSVSVKTEITKLPTKP